MATVAAPLRHFSSRQLVCSCCYGCVHMLSSSFSSSTLSIEEARVSKSAKCFPLFALGKHRRILFSSGFAFLPAVSSPGRRFIRVEGRSPYADSAFLEEDSEYATEQDGRKSRNQKKREARRAVQWGMDLAKFSPSQIKLILRVAALEKEVYDAIILVKRLGPDVREGKRRQFSYIGKLLRNAEPELMDEMIRAMKDGDVSKIQVLSAQEVLPLEGELDDDDDDDEEVTEDSDDDDVDGGFVETAGRWLDGLINKDLSIINDVYAINSIDFDRQELRRLVRCVQSMQDHRGAEEGEEESEKQELTKAKSSLSRFLIQLAKQSAVE